jgi:hypothetical protein
MTPTAKLRFVERVIFKRINPTAVSGTESKKLILQQWWAPEGLIAPAPVGEWRDVPVEDEAKNEPSQESLAKVQAAFGLYSPSLAAHVDELMKK